MMDNINIALRQRNASVCLALGMLICNFVLGICLYSKSQKIQIDIPPRLEDGVEINGKFISPSYQRDMALFLVHLMYNKSVRSQRFNHKTLLGYVAPFYQPKMLAQLKADEVRYQSESLSTVFYPHTTVSHIDRNIVRITGELVATVSSREVAREKMTLDVGFKYIYGKWKVVKFVGVKNED